VMSSLVVRSAVHALRRRHSLVRNSRGTDLPASAVPALLAERHYAQIEYAAKHDLPMRASI
jgi:hypothetical protein